MKASAAVRASMRGNDPTAEQWKAIAAAPEPQAIIAGAGSGKTAIMAARMVWMAEQGLVRPGQILGLTFTNKAARELEERIDVAFDRMDPSPEDRPTVSTYNAFADRLVREHGLRIGFDPDSALLSQAQAWQLLGESLDNIEPFEAIDSRSIASITRSALSLADQCANNFVTAQEVVEEDRRVMERAGAYEKDVLTCSGRRIELCSVVRAYQDLKKLRRCMDYGDQVTKAVEVLEKWPSVAAELQAKYPAILLDEYQDTNVAQRRLLQAMAPQGSNVTAVGDARQNIFQWRGSTLYNLIDFPDKHFLRTGGKRHDYLSLADNFRSGSRIVELANTVIDQVPGDRRPGQAQAAVRANLEGFVGAKLLEDQRREAQFIAGEIQRLHGEPAAVNRPPVGWKDCAVLVRRKSHMSTIYSTLREADVPVEVVGLGGLLQVPEVLDTVAWLRLVADPGPGSNRWLARIVFGPRFRVHYRDLAVLARWAAARTREMSDAKRESSEAIDGAAVLDETAFEPDEQAFSLVEALDHLDRIEGLAQDARTRLQQLHGELAELRVRSSLPLLDLVQTILSRCDIAEALRASPRQDAGASLGNLRQFMNLVANFSPVTGDPSLGEFLEYLDAAEDADDPMGLEVSSSEDSVKLMTIHAAKGLEFEVVFVPGVASGENAKGDKVYSIFPDERASNPMISFSQLPYRVREDRHHLPDPMTLNSKGSPTLKNRRGFADELRARAVEDERRLFYVALTRARQRLYVTAAWWYERQRRPHGPSVFFEEVAAHPQVQDLGVAERPEASPLMQQLAARAVWPPKLAARGGAAPELPDGPVAALKGLLGGELTAGDLLGRLHGPARARAEELLEGHRAAARALGSDPGQTVPDALPLQSVTASQAVSVASGAGERALRRPLPQKPGKSALMGTEIHRWIEEQARGLTGLVDEEGIDDRLTDVDQAKLGELKNAFVRMGFAQRTLAELPGGEPMAELRFVLKVGRHLVRGRMDAVYEMDGGLEIVDFKSGVELEIPEVDQLVLYAAALRKLGIVSERSLRLTYCYLASARTESRSISAEEVDGALESLASRLASVSAQAGRG
ncbi:MAG: ATP-dependent DNA helicase [Actinomycetota bacterium]